MNQNDILPDGMRVENGYMYAEIPGDVREAMQLYIVSPEFNVLIDTCLRENNEFTHGTRQIFDFQLTGFLWKHTGKEIQCEKEKLGLIQ